MSAPHGNKNAQRWTIETTSALLTIIDRESRHRDVQFLGEALDRAGLHKNIWSYWRSVWKEEADIVYRMSMIEQRFENKILSGAMNNRLHPSTAHLVLKTNYGYHKAKSTSELDSGIAVIYEPENILKNLKALPSAETPSLAEHSTQQDTTTISLMQKHPVENAHYSESDLLPRDPDYAERK